MFHTGSGSSPPLIAEMKKPAELAPGGPTGFGLYRLGYSAQVVGRVAGADLRHRGFGSHSSDSSATHIRSRVFAQPAARN